MERDEERAVIKFYFYFDDFMLLSAVFLCDVDVNFSLSFLGLKSLSFQQCQFPFCQKYYSKIVGIFVNYFMEIRIKK